MRNAFLNSGAGDAGSPRAVPVTLTCALSMVELNKLSRSIENAIPDTENMVVQFASAYHSGGTSNIAFELAMISALSGKRVLFIDTTGTQHPIARKLAEAVNAPLDIFFEGEKSFSESVVCADKTTLFYTVLRNARSANKALHNLGNLQDLLSSLRTSYNLIVIDSVAVLGDPFGVSLAKSVDGTILVVEAERTRIPVALQTRLIIQESGGNVIGAVLNNRRFYIPPRIYRWLYHRHNTQ